MLPAPQAELLFDKLHRGRKWGGTEKVSAICGNVPKRSPKASSLRWAVCSHNVPEDRKVLVVSTEAPSEMEMPVLGGQACMVSPGSRAMSCARGRHLWQRLC